MTAEDKIKLETARGLRCYCGSVDVKEVPLIKENPNMNAYHCDKCGAAWTSEIR